MFDHLYMLAEGQCMYQGRVEGLVPFLGKLKMSISTRCSHNFIDAIFSGSLGYECPSYHNPADYGKHFSDVFSLSFSPSILTFKSHSLSNIVHKMQYAYAILYVTIIMFGEVMHYMYMNKEFQHSKQKPIHRVYLSTYPCTADVCMSLMVTSSIMSS